MRAVNEKDLTFVLRFRNEAARQMKALSGNFGKIAVSVTKAAAKLDKIGRALKKVGTQLQAAGKKAEAFGRRIGEIGATFTTRLTAPLAAAGAGIIATAGSFEQSLNRVQGVTNATAEEFDLLKNAASELGATTAFTATDAAEALFFLGKTGLNTTESLAALPEVLNLAAASGLDLSSAADIVTNVTKGFGQSLDQLPKSIDVLATAFTSANVDIQGLGQSFRKAGPVFAANNQTFSDTAAILGVLGDSGIQASEAGTAARIAFQSLQADSVKTNGVLAKLGVTIRDAEGNFKPLIEIVGELGQAGLDSEQRLKLFGRRGDAIAAILLQKGAPALRQFSDELDATSGTAKRLADVQLKGLFGAFRILKSSVEAVAIEIGDSGLLKQVTELVSGLAEWVRGLRGASATTLKFAVAIGIALASIGPILVSLGFATLGIGALTNAMGGLINVSGKLFTSLAKLPGVLTTVAASVKTVTVALLTNPFGLLAVGVAAAVAAFIIFKDEIIEVGGQTQTVTDFIIGAWETVKERVAPLFNLISDAALSAYNVLSSLTASVVNAVGSLWDGFGAFVGTQFTSILDVAKFAGNNIIKVWQLAALGIQTSFKIISIVAENVFDGIRTRVEALKAPFEVLTQGLVRVGTSIVEAFGVVRTFVVDTFTGLGEAIGRFFGETVDGVNDLAAAAGTKLKEISTDFGDFTKATAEGTVFEGVPEAIEESLGKAGEILAGDPLGDFFADAGAKGAARFNERVAKDIGDGLEKVLKPGGKASAGGGDPEAAGGKAGFSFASGFKDGFNKGAEEFITDAANAAAQGQKFFEDFSDATSTAFGDLISKGEADWKAFGLSILESFNDILVQRIQGQLLQAVGLGGEQGQAANFGSFFGGGGGGGGGGGAAAGAAGAALGGGEDSKVVSAINKQTTDQLTNDTGLFGGFFSGLGEKFSSALDGLGSLFSGGIGGLADKFTSGLSNIGGLFTSGLSSLGGVFTSGLQGLGSLLGGGGGGGGIGGILGSIVGAFFADGGISNSPGAGQMGLINPKAMAGAKRFNSGGLTDSIPAMLSPGEAVVPLPNGRAIPVDMQGTGGGGNPIVVNFNLPEGADVESFKQSQAQITAQSARAISRANARNN